MQRIHRIVGGSVNASSNASLSIGSSGIAVLTIFAACIVVIAGMVIAMPIVAARQNEDTEKTTKQEQVVDDVETAKSFAETVQNQQSKLPRIANGDDDETPITDPRTILELEPLESKTIRFKNPLLSVDGHDAEIVDIQSSTPTHLRLRILQRGVSRMQVTDSEGQRFQIWVLALGDTPLSDADRIKLIASSGVTKITATNTTLELFLNTTETIEFRNRPLSVDVFDTNVIRVDSLAANQLRLQNLKAGLTTMVVTDELKQRFVINVVAFGNPPLPAMGQLKLMTDLGKSHLAASRTAHLKLRTTRFSSERIRTSVECDAFLRKFAESKEEDLYGLFRREFVEREPEPYDLYPWVDEEVYVSGDNIRELQSWDDMSSLHICRDGISIDMDRSNNRVQIRESINSPVAFRNVIPFGSVFHPIGFDSYEPEALCDSLGKYENARIQRENGLITIICPHDDEDGGSTEIVIDEHIGYAVRGMRRDKVGRVLAEHHSLGWTKSASGIPYPRRVITFHYRDGTLSLVEAKVVQQVRFNIPVDASTFIVGAPAGATIVDIRPGFEINEKINREIFDVTSVEQRREACAKIENERTPLEKLPLRRNLWEKLVE